MSSNTETKRIVVSISDHYTGENRLSFGYAIPIEQWYELRASRGPVDPIFAIEESYRAEKRQRVVDMIAAQIAHALINALIDGK